MHNYIPGQRWISNAELQLGLGTIVNVDFRTIDIVFLSCGETRTYAKQTAPLSRVQFTPGDTTLSHEGWKIHIESVTEQDGLLTYHGKREDGSPAALEEGHLDNFIQLNKPTDRLHSGQLDANKWFELRYNTRLFFQQLKQSDIPGLIGGRTSLIPHQLYIAREVATRFAPRVLLADEVGLGKTIEAGMILHQQLSSERAKRALIIIPESLLHQWLVEMLRRFNLTFSIFDEERCIAAEESTEQDNPFHTEQLVICTLGFLTGNERRFNQALQGEWDLMIVDEAHHLQWSPEFASIEYQCIEKLARIIPGVLLLTATPEQLGKESHFARLRLLDAERFPDFEHFVQEESSFEPIAEAVRQIMEQDTLNQKQIDHLSTIIQAEDNQPLLATLQDNDATPEQQHQARQDLIEHLLDRHGTGRVLFRNTRAAIKGFPSRKLMRKALPLPRQYLDVLKDYQTVGHVNPQALLCPERIYQAQEMQADHWTLFDPRVNWLVELLKQTGKEKLLVITASAETAMDLAESLRVKQGIHAAVFHEGLSLLDRDRAAAFFADKEYGCPLLISSEIGSEGRNFQFAHHLVMFDLPLNPDLLEQRIGRLDRIGQTETIQIHVPFIQGSAQEVMFHWYHEGLNAFEHTCPAGHTIFSQIQDTLLESIHQIDDGLEDLPELIATSQQLNQTLNQALHRGRDLLLEYNSCRPHVASQIQQLAEQQDSDTRLLPYLEQAFDCYGVDFEETGLHRYSARPGEHMHNNHFPGLNDDGIGFTINRNTALSHDDISFLTWEHPILTGVRDMILSSESGNCAVTAIKVGGIKPGTLLLENIYIIEAGSDTRPNDHRYLPASMIRVVMDPQANNHEAQLTPEVISQYAIPVNKETALKIITGFADQIRSMTDQSEKLAYTQLPELARKALESARHDLFREINRLKALQQINPNVRDSEIQFFETEWAIQHQLLESLTLRLDATRVIVST